MAPFKKKPEPVSARRRPTAAPDTGRRSEMFSYYSRRSASQTNTGRLDASAIQAAKAEAGTKPVARRWLAPAIAGVIIIVFIALTALSGSPRVTVEGSNGSQYFIQDASVYRQAVLTNENRTLLDKNKLTFDSAGLSQSIKQEYPEIKSVEIKLPLFGSAPSVMLTPYKADYILTTLSGGSYILDEAGHAVISTSQLPDQNSLHLPILDDKSGRSISLNSQAIASTTVNFADQVRSVLNGQHVAIGNLSLPANTSELDIAISGKPYFVKFNLQGDPRLEAGTYLAVKHKLEQDGTTPAQYIDVRVPERAYYK